MTNAYDPIRNNGESDSDLDWDVFFKTQLANELQLCDVVNQS
jgi:hypothetical protein